MPIERLMGEIDDRAEFVLEQFGLLTPKERGADNLLSLQELQEAFARGLDGQVLPQEMVQRLQMDQLGWGMWAGESGVVFFGVQDGEESDFDDALVTVEVEAARSDSGNQRIRAIRVVGLEKSRPKRLLMGSYERLDGNVVLQSAGISLADVEIPDILRDEGMLRRIDNTGTRDFDFCNPDDQRFNDRRMGVITHTMHLLAAVPTLCVVARTESSGLEYSWPKPIGVAETSLIICRYTDGGERYVLDRELDELGWEPVAFLPTRFDFVE